MQRLSIFSTLLLLLVLLSACATAAQPRSTSTPAQPQPTTEATSAPSGGADAANEAQVTIQNFSFNPASLTIKAGTTVTWTNKDSVTHTVTSGTRDNPSKLFDSGNLAQGQSFSFTFKDPGTYEYFCIPHTNMQAQIIVQ